MIENVIQLQLFFLFIYNFCLLKPWHTHTTVYCSYICTRNIERRKDLSCRSKSRSLKAWQSIRPLQSITDLLTSTVQVQVLTCQHATVARIVHFATQDELINTNLMDCLTAGYVNSKLEALHERANN
jgi:hypothetical protein